MINEPQESGIRELEDLKAALDAHAMVAITDPRGIITRVNEKFCAISKYSRHELIGQDHRIINSGHHSKDFFRELWTAIARGKVWKGEVKNKAKDGSFYWVDTTIVPFLNGEGKPRQYVAFGADITERKRADEKILQRNGELEQRLLERAAQLEAANKELEAFSYSVSHDLRAPLRAVEGFSRVMLEDYGPRLPEDARHSLQTIRNGALKMAALIDDLLSFSRLMRLPLNKRPVDTAKLARETVEELSLDLKGRQIDVRIGALPPCQADPGLLKQVWVNLLSNAFKYTGKHQAPVVEIGCSRENGRDAYFVRDNGIGFDMKYANRLFGVFQRLHRAEDYEGTGVGLAIAQRIILRHGGRIWAESAPDCGATFHFALEEESPPSATTMATRAN